MEKFGDTPLNFKDGTTKDSMTKVIQFLVILINEAVDIHNDSSEEKWDYVDEKYVGRYVSVHDFTKILNVVADVFCFPARKPLRIPKTQTRQPHRHRH